MKDYKINDQVMLNGTEAKGMSLTRQMNDAIDRQLILTIVEIKHNYWGDSHYYVLKGHELGNIGSIHDTEIDLVVFEDVTDC